MQAKLNLKFLILNLKSDYVPRTTRTSAVHGLSQFDLPDQAKQRQEQPGRQEAFGASEILQVLQKENFAQGNQIMSSKKQEVSIKLNT